MHFCSSRKYPASTAHSSLFRAAAKQMSEHLQVLKESRADPQVQFVTHTHTQSHRWLWRWELSTSHCPSEWGAAAGGLIHRASNWKSVIKTARRCRTDMSTAIDAIFHFHIEKLVYAQRGESRQTVICSNGLSVIATRRPLIHRAHVGQTGGL